MAISRMYITVEFSSQEIDLIVRTAAARSKVSAIKIVKELTKCTWRIAKTIVDFLSDMVYAITEDRKPKFSAEYSVQHDVEVSQNGDSFYLRMFNVKYF